MKTTITVLITLVLLAGSLTAFAAALPAAAEKKLGVGAMQVYDYGDVKLHAYLTGDALSDVCFLLEMETSVIGIETPAFTANLEEYAQYIKDLGKPMNSLLVSYHPTGAGYFAGAETLGTREAQAAHHEGGSIKGLVDSFTTAFGDAFDADIIEIGTIIEPGTRTVDGVEMIITPAADAYEIEIPAIGAVYTHMMGSDVHNILVSAAQIDGMIETLKGYQAKGYTLILTSHYAPEAIDAAVTKIAYLERTQQILAESASADAFLAAMRDAFPGYSGENYLEMSAGILFP